ncbi:hypothetical protein CLAFUW4_05236 [Fulvia fulva]|nr:hypothetical protein CLAFUR4_05222 [Fulvia fulva]WPV13580.1 hypothetical protein CLAFUW4_05236 [Fulvia fulva]WPV29007.1 hypothetical protein CLAFUW7_05232 [Fulvia fulva]
MARLSHIRTSQMPSSRDSSPDPLDLPTSPLVRHSPIKRQSSVKRSLSPRKVGRPRITATPTKSVVLDTPGAGDASPWRIKVTVEAEPRDGSPGKRMTRTTTVPPKDETSKRSSSPTKRTSPRKGTPAETKKPARKRKGTPIRDARPARPPPEVKATPEVTEAVQQRSHSPAGRASGRLAQLSGTPGSARYQRLSYAREELDAALQAAVGMSDAVPRCDPPGDKTVSMNEDFSMISVDSLQATREHGLSNSMRSMPDGEKSAVMVSYMASSPPKPQYPDLSKKSEMARSRLGQSATTPYDSMSGKSLEPARSVLSSAMKQSPLSQQQTRKASNEEQWQRERESVSRKIQSAPQENVVVVDDDVHDDDDVDEDMVDEGDQPADNADDEDDLWQTEASREVKVSMRDSRRSQHDPTHVAPPPQDREPQLEDLFADQPLKPARPKIPRTWRRSSGMDFEYIDSPAHQPVVDDVERAEDRKDSPDGSGVLTPPDTDSEDDEAEQVDVAQPAEHDQQDQETSDFEPDAEATRVHGSDVVDKEAQPLEAEAEQEDEIMSDDSVSPNGEDTGNFFAMNLPKVYTVQEPPKRRGRPPRQPSMNLTELLNLDGTNSPVKPAMASLRRPALGDSRQQAGGSYSLQRPNQPQARRVDSAVNHSSSVAESSSKSLSSPLRKSLLRSSKMHGSPSAAEKQGPRPDVSHDMPPRRGRPRSGFFKKDRQEDAAADSFEGKTSDQQQLLQEARAISNRTHLQYIQDYAREHSNSQNMEMSDAGQDSQPRNKGKQPYVQQEEDALEEESGEEETDVHGPSGSYEERLNLESPGKVMVNFNDSRTSSLLAPTRHYPPLFDQPPPPRQQTQQLKPEDSPNTGILVAKRPTTTTATSTQTGIFSRLTSTFWSAITHPVAPVIDPAPPQPVPKPESLDAHFPPSLRAQLRERYGIVHDRFPWTMHHMRTVHRMLNSLTSGRADTLIPTRGRLPDSIAFYINKTLLSATGYEFFFTEQLAYVVWSFFQLRMPAHVIERMENGEDEWLGDTMAERCRGWFDSRHGSEELFQEVTHGKQVAEWVNRHEGIIGVNFVVRVLGVCVRSNELHGGP